MSVRILCDACDGRDPDLAVARVEIRGLFAGQWGRGCIVVDVCAEHLSDAISVAQAKLAVAQAMKPS